MIVTQPQPVADILARRFNLAKLAYDEAIRRALRDPNPIATRELDEALAELTAAQAACAREREREGS